MDDYVKVSVGDLGESYFRRDRTKEIEMIDAVIFDCDGVLIDVRESYNRAISRTVSKIVEAVTKCRFPEDLITDRMLFAFRRSGGFNNDWDLTYTILTFILCNLPPKIRESIEKHLKMTKEGADPHEKLLDLMREAERDGLSLLDRTVIGKLIDDLFKFAGKLDSTGIDSVNKNLLIDESLESFYEIIRDFLNYPGDVGESIIATLFEEVFCGSSLFREVYGLEPKFYRGRGLIENERLIVKPNVLDRLGRIIGGFRFGISSGSGVRQAEYVLGNLLRMFNHKALVFKEDIDRAEREVGVRLWKPNPYPLLRSASALEPFRYALYVGDSMEDLIMVDEARRTDKRFLFAGVYYYSSPREEALKAFLEAGCDLILPSVNELPDVLEMIKGGFDF